MISRIVLVAALAAGTLALMGPTYAQTGVSGQGAVNSGAANPNGSVGTTSNTPRNNSSSSSPTMGPMGGGTTNSPGMSSQNTMGTSAEGSMQGRMSGSQANMIAGGAYQAQAHMSGGKRGNAAERQMTECLNNAAAQHQSFDSCRR